MVPIRLSPTNDVRIVACSCMYLTWRHDAMSSWRHQHKFLSLVVDKLQRWTFFCFHGFSGQGSQCNISQPCNLDAWPCTSRLRDLDTWPRTSRSLDLDVQGHASRLQCWLMLHWVSWWKTRETKKVHRCSLSTTRDRKGPIQGQVTSTYKVTRQGYSVGLYWIEFPDPKNHGNKKVHRCSMSTTRDRKCPIQGHVTMTYQVTRQGYSVGLCCIKFPGPKNQGNKKVHRSSLSTTRDKNHVIGVMTSCCQIVT